MLHFCRVYPETPIYAFNSCESLVLILSCAPIRNNGRLGMQQPRAGVLQIFDRTIPRNNGHLRMGSNVTVLTRSHCISRLMMSLHALVIMPSLRGCVV
jgi:hypothetical protein